MKKLLLLFIVTASLLYANSNAVQKGKTYYQYILKPMLGYNGAVFAKKHTKQEWKEMFENNASAFKEKFQSESKALGDFMKKEKFTKISDDLKAFVMFYAKDASVTPSCQE